MYKLLIMVYPFFPSSSSWRAKSTSSLRQNILWFSFQISFKPKAHNRIVHSCQSTNIIHRLKTSSHHVFLLYCHTSPTFSDSSTSSSPSHHLPLWPPSINNFKRPLLLLIAWLNKSSHSPPTSMFYKWKTKHCMVCNNPHLFWLTIYHNPHLSTQCKISGKTLWLPKCYPNIHL